jgi:membrane protein YqaA with SNARE-associated domain
VLLGWGPQGLLLMGLLDSAGVPIVGGVDALLLAIAANEPQQAYWAACCAVIGSLAGSLVLFFIARKGGEVLLMRHVASRTGARMHLWFQRYGLITVFIPAISPFPLPMKIPVFCAGALQVRWGYFAIVVLAARTIRYVALAYLGRRYGHEGFTYLKSHGWQAGLGALALALAAAIALRMFQRHEAALGKAE